jgi:glycosyltransferase involved in cell wall biosynthesis
MGPQIKIIQTVPSLAMHHGGPSYTVAALASALAEMPDLAVHLVTNLGNGVQNVAPSSAVALHDVGNEWPARHFRTRRILREIAAEGKTVIHDNGIWHSQNVASTGFARRENLPYVISPHGMLEPWALSFRSTKKKIARRLYQDRLLRSARCLMATSTMEFDSIRKAGFLNPVAIVPNGVDHDIPVLERKAPPLPRTALFLSRLHPKKGLVHAIEAWNLLRPRDWRLKIVGPSEGGHREVLQSLVRDFGLQDSVEFHEPVSGVEKFQCYYDADLFLLPTHSENFGVVVAEALACGLPVLTTVGTPWKELDARGCGWCIEIGTAPLVAALEKIFRTDSAELQRMGAAGRTWIARDFQWTAIAAQCRDVYEWVLGRAPAPAFVHQ